MRPASSVPFRERSLRQGDEAKVIELLTTVFGHWPGRRTPVPPIEHLRWKLRSHEKAAECHIVAEAGPELVGVRISLARKVKIKERILLARQGADVAVRPDYQRRGVLTRMFQFHRQQLDESFDLGFGNTSHPAALKLDARKGHRPLGNRIQVLQCASFRSRAVKQTSRPEPWTISTTTAFDSRIDAFWEEASKPFDFIVVRTKDYLNWRYCDVRSGISEVLLAEQDGDVIGYTALRVAGTTGHIVDLLALPGRLDVTSCLLREAFLRFSSASVSNVESWLPSHHPYAELFRDSGFTFKNAMPFTYNPMRTARAYLCFLDEPGAAVHLAAGDLDLV